MKKILVLFAMFALFAINAFGDIPRPNTPKPKQSRLIDSRMTIRISRDAKEAKLIIPKSQVKQLRAELEELDGESDTTAASTINFTRTQTIVSGLFLSLAFVFGGVWLARGRKTELKANKALVVGANFCAGVSWVLRCCRRAYRQFPAAGFNRDDFSFRGRS